MIGEERCRLILQQALHLSGVDEIEAYFSGQDLALTRFANKAIHQNVVHGDARLNIRAVIGHQPGRSTTNDLSESGIARAGEEARANARLMPEDPDFLGLPEPGIPAVVAAYDESTADCDPTVRAKKCRQSLSFSGTSGSQRLGVFPEWVRRTGGNEYPGYVELPSGFLRRAVDYGHERFFRRLGRGSAKVV